MASTMNEQRPAFVSLGLVVLDEIRRPAHPAQYDVAGGSGAFSVLGARLVAGGQRSADVGCFIQAGNDFPESAVRCFESWGINLVIQTEATRKSTRGLLEYQDAEFGKKTFRYTTTPLQPAPRDLPSNLLGAGGFHLLAKPVDVEIQVEEILRLRKGTAAPERPLLLWEPFPPLCSRETRDQHMAASKRVDVFSPNHLELMALCHDSQSAETAPPFDPRAIESCADIFLDSGVGPDGKGIVLVRAGEHGCLVASTEIPGRHKWLPPCASSAYDATGAGNTFLGAFAFAMSGRGSDAIEAAQVANVAASFALEQVGLPVLERSVDGGSPEKWNGTLFSERYASYKIRIGAIEHQ